MAKLENYNGTVDVLAGLRAKGQSDFPLVTAHDVQTREDGTRLDAELEMLRAGSAAIYAGTVTTTDTGNGNVLGNLGVVIPLTQGAAYKVTFNGIDYKCVGSKEDVYPYLGNAHFLNDSREDTGEPFCLTFATNTTYLETAAAGSYTLAIYEATGGGLSVTEVSSPEEITADSPDGFYVVPGGESGGGSGTPIYYYDSLDAVPADLPEGSFVAVPSSGESGGGASDEVVDLTGVFDLVTSVLAGGEEQEVAYDCTEIIERFKRGAVKLKGKMGTMIVTGYVNAVFVGDSLANASLITDNNGTMMCATLKFASDYDKILYTCKAVTTQPIQLS